MSIVKIKCVFYTALQTHTEFAVQWRKSANLYENIVNILLVPVLIFVITPRLGHTNEMIVLLRFLWMDIIWWWLWKRRLWRCLESTLFTKTRHFGSVINSLLKIKDHFFISYQLQNIICTIIMSNKKVQNNCVFPCKWSICSEDVNLCSCDFHSVHYHMAALICLTINYLQARLLFFFFFNESSCNKIIHKCKGGPEFGQCKQTKTKIWQLPSAASTVPLHHYKILITS